MALVPDESRRSGRRVIERDVADTDTMCTLGVHPMDCFDVQRLQHVPPPRPEPDVSHGSDSSQDF